MICFKSESGIVRSSVWLGYLEIRFLHAALHIVYFFLGVGGDLYIRLILDEKRARE